MAELPEQVRRVGGELVARKQPGGRRVLLPTEAELCNALGLTVDDYFYFLELAEAYNGKRAKEYELVPDIKGDIVSIIISLVIGIALSAIGALLAPKPQEPKKPPQTKTPDVKGQSRFAPQTAFDSIQDLASLGATIPLVFARKGVRVSSQLLWSQMLSFGTGQQLRALMLFSSGQIEGRPDFAGYAIGDGLLENYINAKIALYFRPAGGRIAEGGAERYAEGTANNAGSTDAFSVYWEPSSGYQPFFSGTRTPGTSTQFGLYRPMPNGTKYKVDYELLLKPKDAKKEQKADIDTKRAKIAGAYPRRAAIVHADGSTVIYRIDGGTDDGKQFEPWGSEDIASSVEGARFAADEAIGLGDSYMAGTALVVATNIPPEPWRVGYTKDCSFRVVEAGMVETAGVNDTREPYDTFLLQRAAVGTVSNNRDCDCTELGLKSTVWRQITGFSNVNARPGQEVADRYEKENGSFQLGGINKYIFRVSFFTLEVRPLGSKAEWRNISNGTLFCIYSNTPQPAYNYLRVHHPRGQYEFRLRPYAGNAALRFCKNRDVWQLLPGFVHSYKAEEYLVSFSGKRRRLSNRMLSNPEWVLGDLPVITSTVVDLSNTVNGNRPVGFRRVEGPLFSTSGGFPFPTQTFWTAQGLVYWKSQIVGWAYSRHTTEIYASSSVKYVREYLVLFAFYAVSRYEMGVLPPDKTVVVAGVGGSGTGLTFNVGLYANGSSSWSIANGGEGYEDGDSVFIPQANVTVSVFTNDREIVARSLNPYDAISDINLYDSERSSHDDGPEHEIVYVNEQLSQIAPQYNNLAIAGIRINSSKEWSQFNSLSAYFKTGVIVERLTTSGRSATNLLPEIAYALLTDPVIGAGKLVGARQVDRDRMTLAARFCEANGFTWDGVLSERTNLREWIFEQAGYCMLDFTVLGGQFSLIPSVPYTTAHQIDFGGKPPIKALFTDGNIRNLKVTWLSPEERQLFKAVCLWRQDKDNGFPETQVIAVRLADSEGGTDADPEETFDMSGWCTTQAHAYTFARYALKVRQKVTHGITFETTPQSAMNLAPGEYFRLVSEVTHTSRFNNGSIGPDGAIQSANVLNGTYPILYWVPGTVGVETGTLVANGSRTDQAALFGTVFTLNNTTTVSRVYKVETLSYGEEGLVDVAASEAPLTSSGSLAILDWDDAMFDVELG